MKNHYVSRYEQNKEDRFRTRVKWGDSNGGGKKIFTFTILEYVKRDNAFKFSGYGEQYWEYNHATPDQPTKSKETEKSTDV